MENPPHLSRTRGWWGAGPVCLGLLNAKASSPNTSATFPFGVGTEHKVEVQLPGFGMEQGHTRSCLPLP